MFNEKFKFTKNFSLLCGVTIGMSTNDSLFSIPKFFNNDLLQLKIPNLVFEPGIHLMLGFSYYGHSVSLPVYFFESDLGSIQTFLMIYAGCVINKLVSEGFKFVKEYFNNDSQVITNKRLHSQKFEDQKINVLLIRNHLNEMSLESNRNFMIIKW
jgi:hypothetical protein